MERGKWKVFEQKHRNGVRYERMSPYFTVTMTLAVCWRCFVFTSARAAELPTLAQIKLAAENGDAQAQSTLGDRYARYSIIRRRRGGIDWRLRKGWRMPNMNWVCYNIGDASVVVGIAGTAERKELTLRGK